MVWLPLGIRRALEADMILLASMNKHLIEDEGSQNPMNLKELEDRMRNWYHADWNIDILHIDDKVVGYTVYQYREQAYDQNQRDIYIRQYFIQREYRKQGYGQQGINLLREKRFEEIKTIIIEVLNSNSNGMRFWSKMGFQAYSTTMKLYQ